MRKSVCPNLRPGLLLEVFVLFFVLVFVGGCSSAEPTTRYYLLSDPSQPASDSGRDQVCGVQLGSTTVAPYLQRTNIVVQRGENELVPALVHRWSEPVEAGISRLLSRCLGGNAQSSSRVSVHVDHLHGDTTGRVVLQAQWSLENTSDAPLPKIPIQSSFSTSAPQPAAGYDALVSTQRELVLKLCADIQAAVPTCS